MLKTLPKVLFLALFLAALLAPPAAAQNVLIVDGSQYTSLGQALGAAQPGDVILLRKNETGFVTIDKGVTILGEGGTRTIPSCSTIQNIRAGEKLQLVNVTFVQPFPQAASLCPQLIMKDCFGEVVLDGVSVDGLEFFIDNCSLVHVTGCMLRGAPGFIFGATICTSTFRPGGDALSIKDSYVGISLCDIQGGNGANCPWQFIGCFCPFLVNTPGGNALRADGSDITIVHSNLAGGLPDNSLSGPPFNLPMLPNGRDAELVQSRLTISPAPGGDVTADALSSVAVYGPGGQVQGGVGNTFDVRLLPELDADFALTTSPPELRLSSTSVFSNSPFMVVLALAPSYLPLEPVGHRGTILASLERSRSLVWAFDAYDSSGSWQRNDPIPANIQAFFSKVTFHFQLYTLTPTGELWASASDTVRFP